VKKIVLTSRKSRPRLISKRLWPVFSVCVVRKNIFVRRLLK